MEPRRNSFVASGIYDRQRGSGSLILLLEGPKSRATSCSGVFACMVVFDRTSAVTVVCTTECECALHKSVSEITVELYSSCCELARIPNCRQLDDIVKSVNSI